LDAKNFNIVDSFLQVCPAMQNNIFQPALRRQKPRTNKKRAICEWTQIALDI